VRLTVDDSSACQSVIASPNHHFQSREVKALPMILVDFQHFVFDFLFRSIARRRHHRCK
jgi:hypothetical protein